MSANSRTGTAALRVCLSCALAAALAAGCETPPDRKLQWDDVTGRLRDHAALDVDYERCRADRERAFLRSEGAPAGSWDFAAQGGGDAAFLSCMQRNGWKPRRATAR